MTPTFQKKKKKNQFFLGYWCLDEYMYCVSLCSDARVRARAKRSLIAWVVVIPKEGHGPAGPPFFWYDTDFSKKKERKKNQNNFFAKNPKIKVSVIPKEGRRLYSKKKKIKKKIRIFFCFFCFFLGYWRLDEYMHCVSFCRDARVCARKYVSQERYSTHESTSEIRRSQQWEWDSFWRKWLIKIKFIKGPAVVCF